MIRRVEDAALVRAAAALEGLRPALERLEALLADALRRAREMQGDSTLPDAYRGLVIREEEARAALSRPVATPPPHAGLAGDPPEAATLAVIADRFGLASADLDLVLLALAPDIDPRYGRIMAYLQDDATRRRPTVALALDLLATSPAHQLALCSRLTARAPLAKGALVELVDDPHHPIGLLPERMLRAAPSVVAAALGAPEVDPALTDWCTLAVPAAPTPLAEVALDPDIVGRLAAFADEPVGLIGGDNLQRDAAIASLARAAGWPVLTAELRRRGQRGAGRPGWSAPATRR